ncbi:unnamed protein product [Trichobilharzia regenti]|nr:unnamed protein product [Trichobilharzia regenti]
MQHFTFETKIYHNVPRTIIDIFSNNVKPVLKKVSKTESHMARFEKKEGGHSLSSFRSQLKSTGHSKYALEEKDEPVVSHVKAFILNSV